MKNGVSTNGPGSEDALHDGSFVRVSENERQALAALFEVGESEDVYCYLPFKAIQKLSGLPQHLVRRTVRALARKGLAQFQSGLCTEDGDFAGSGYGITTTGRALMQGEASGTDGGGQS